MQSIVQQLVFSHLALSHIVTVNHNSPHRRFREQIRGYSFQNAPETILVPHSVFRQSQPNFRHLDNTLEHLSHHWHFVGVNQLEYRPAEHFRRRVAQNPLLGRRDIAAKAFLVENDDNISGIFNQRSKALLALAQFLFGALAIGNVGIHVNQTDNCPCGVFNRIGPQQHLQYLATFGAVGNFTRPRITPGDRVKYLRGDGGVSKNCRYTSSEFKFLCSFPFK